MRQTQAGEKPSSGIDLGLGAGQAAISSSLSSGSPMASSVNLGGLGGVQFML